MESEEIRSLLEVTGFTSGQIERLHSRFLKLDIQKKGFLQREDLLKIPHLAINPLGDRIIHAFFFGKEDHLEFLDFVKVLSFFRPVDKKHSTNTMNTKREKLLFSFRMYDLDGDGEINVDELMAVLTMMIDNMEEKELRKIAEKFIEELDRSKDALISFDEFTKIMDSCDVERKMSMRFLG